jgi:integrase
MNEVNAIKSKADLERVETFITKHYSEVISDAWRFGLQVSLRVSDLLAIEFSDIKNDMLTVKAQKTSKSIQIRLNGKALDIVKRRKAYGNKYLFQSTSNRAKSTNKPITRQTLSKALQDASSIIDTVINTHSMRKTWGYFQYRNTNNIALVQKALQHSSTAHTLRYIGIDQDELDDAFTCLEL